MSQSPGRTFWLVCQAGFLLLFLCASRFSYGGAKGGEVEGRPCQQALADDKKGGASGRKKRHPSGEKPWLIKTLESLYGGKWKLDGEEERRLIVEYQETGSESAFNRLLYSHIRIIWRAVLQVTFEEGAPAMALHVREEILSNIVRSWYGALTRYDTEFFPRYRLASFALYRIEERARALMIRYLMSLRTFDRFPAHSPQNAVDDSWSAPHEGRVYFEQIVRALDQTVKEAGFDEREIHILRNYIFTDNPVSAEVLGKQFGVTGPSLRKTARRLLQKIAESETAGPEVRELARHRLSSTQKPGRGKKPPPEAHPIEPIEDFEEVMTLALKSVEGLILSPAERAVGERCLLAKAPESLRDVGEDLGLSYNEALYLKNKTVKKILQSADVPPAVKNFIRWRVKFSKGAGGFLILFAEEIDRGLKAVKDMDLTDWEEAVLKRCVFTNYPETLKAVGADMGIRNKSLSRMSAALKEKIREKEGFPAELKSVVERKLTISKKANRPFRRGRGKKTPAVE